MEAAVDAGTVSRASRARHRAAWHESAESRETSGDVRLRRVRSAALYVGDQIRKWHRVAELLQANRRGYRHHDRYQLRDATRGGALLTMRGTPRSRISGWSGADGRALLHERLGDALRADAGRARPWLMADRSWI